MTIGHAYTMMSMSLKLQFPTTRQLAGAFCAGSIMFSSPCMNNIANARVGEGDLPEGAMAFSKLLKYQSDWDKLAGNIKARQTDIEGSEQETQGIKIFLKQLANEYGDMELLGQGILDKDKSTQAIAIAKTFRKQIRECDDAASVKNFAKVLEIYPTTAAELKDFIGLMQDIPDEI